jgi:hypothetical protein
MAKRMMPVARRIAASIARAPTKGRDQPGRLSNQVLPPVAGGAPWPDPGSVGGGVSKSNVDVVTTTVVVGVRGAVVVVPN